MKRHIFLSTIMAALLCVACDDMDLTTPALTVSVDTGNAVEVEGDMLPVFKKGTQVKFLINADADMITFYSGEPGMMYKNKDRTQIQGLPYMQFNAQTEGTVLSQNYLTVLLSSDFKGFTKDSLTDAGNIKNATWTDITEQCNLPTAITEITTPKIDLSAYAGSPLYVAFRYTRPANKSSWIRYQIKKFTVFNDADGTSYPILNTGNAGWTAFDFLAPQGTDPYLANGGGNSNRVWDFRNASSDDRIYIGYNCDIDNNDWAITAPIDLTSISPDLGQGIKSYSDDRVTEFQYLYNTTGTFTVSFLAINSQYSDKKEIIKEVVIKVVD